MALHHRARRRSLPEPVRRRQAPGLLAQAEAAARRADVLEVQALAGSVRWSLVYAARGEARRLRQLARVPA